MSDVKETAPITREAAAKFMIECARYFDMEPTRNEDSAHWASVSNAQTCRRIAAMLAAAPSPAEALPSQTSGAEAVGYMRPQDNDGKSFWCSRQRNAYYSEPVYLAKPASEPAGGGVREALRTLIDKVHEFGTFKIDGDDDPLAAFDDMVIPALVAGRKALSSPASSSPAEAKAPNSELSAIEKTLLDIVQSGDTAYFKLLSPEQASAFVANAKAFLAARGICAPAEAEALPAGVDDIKAAWSFLQDRLLEFEQEIGSGEEEREWAGHVHPALVRFNRLIAALTSAPVQEDQT